MEKLNYKILFVTCATELNQSYYRLYNKIKALGKMSGTDYHIHTLGIGREWLGGDMKFPGGAYKLNLLKEFLTEYEAESTKPNVYNRTGVENYNSTIICFIDGYDVLPNTKMDFCERLIERFFDYGKDIVFGAEPFCYPDWEKKKDYPETSRKNKYLNSGMYIGYAEKILELLRQDTIPNDSDDQLYYTNKFLNQSSVSIGLDYDCELFFNLHGNTEHFGTSVNKDGRVFYNKNTTTVPFFIHANGTKDIKMLLDSITSRHELDCDPITGIKDNVVEYDTNRVIDKTLRLVVRLSNKKNTNDTLEITDFLYSFFLQSYPQSSISLCVLADDGWLEGIANNFFHQNGNPYRELYIGRSDKDISDDVELIGIQCEALSNYNKNNGIVFDNFIFINDNVILKDEYSLTYLVSQNNGIFSTPMVQEESNFEAYDDIPCIEFLKQNVSGRFIVKNISDIVVVNGYTFIDTLSGTKDLLESVMARHNRLEILTGMVLIADNIDDNIIDVEIVTDEPVVTDVVEPSPLTIRDYTNPLWESKYLKKSLTSMNWELNTIEVHPNSDIITVPAFTEAFCKELIEEVEKANAWEEKRHKSYPAEDVLLEKIGLSEMYNYVLEKYVYPLAIHHWTLEGEDWKQMYPETFVNRYRTDGQDGLAIHHDSSIYTVLVTLNRDFEGGGTIFPSKRLLHKGNVGDLTIHPGLLTHKHGGKPIDSGTRYVLVSFCKKRKYITVGETTYWVQYP